jgi:hypothetical protein
MNPVLCVPELTWTAMHERFDDIASGLWPLIAASAYWSFLDRGRGLMVVLVPGQGEAAPCVYADSMGWAPEVAELVNAYDPQREIVLCLVVAAEATRNTKGIVCAWPRSATRIIRFDPSPVDMWRKRLAN